MARILVTEKLADSGIALMEAQGHQVDVKLGLSPEELIKEVPGVQALVIRSATQVTPEVLAAGSDLVVVGRAGIGLDNVDVEEATRRGVMVVNAPQSNILSAAEHTIALLLAQARNIPQAHLGLVNGKWERSKWEGVELHGKTLGVVGLGKVGTLVAQRALAFGMKLVAYDPYVSQDRARQLGVELMSIDELVASSDFMTIHLPKTPETVGLVGAELLGKAKSSLRIVNTARGGIIDEEALAEALRTRKISGAALDVFSKEPCTDSPLYSLDNVVVTPHLGASTVEAQDKAGATIAEQVILALAGDFVPFAVNVAAADASETIRPFLPLAEKLGRIFASLNDGLPGKLEASFQGAIGGYDTRILTLAVLKGLFSVASDEPVSFVNAPQLAQERGIEIQESRTVTVRDYVNLIELRSGTHSIAGTLSGSHNEPRVVMVDGYVVECPPADFLLFVRNEDRPGMIGLVGTALGEAGVSISSMAVGPPAQGDHALMVLSTDGPTPKEVIEKIASQPGIEEVHSVSAI